MQQIGSYRVQGRGDKDAARLSADALALQQAGARLLVMEMVPATPETNITASRSAMATIGIGAGPDCNGQVLVLYGTLGIFPGKVARFVRDFMNGAASIEDAVARYVSAVKDGDFPGPEYCYCASGCPTARWRSIPPAGWAGASHAGAAVAPATP